MENINNVAKHIVADGTIKLRIRCVAYPASSYHYADAVVVSATSLVLSIDGITDDTFSGATGTLLFSTYTNLGKLVDEINSSDNWEAEIVAGLRSDAINGSELLARSTSTFKMYEEVDLYADSSDSGVYMLGALIEPNKPFDTVHGLDSQQTYHQYRVGLNRIRALINTSDSGAPTLTVYELKPDKASVYKTLGVWTCTDNTEKDTGAIERLVYQAEFGNSIYITMYDDAYQDSGAYLDVEGVVEQV